MFQKVEKIFTNINWNQFLKIQLSLSEKKSFVFIKKFWLKINFIRHFKDKFVIIKEKNYLKSGNSRQLYKISSNQNYIFPNYDLVKLRISKIDRFDACITFRDTRPKYLN